MSPSSCVHIEENRGKKSEKFSANQASVLGRIAEKAWEKSGKSMAFLDHVNEAYKSPVLSEFT